MSAIDDLQTLSDDQLRPAHLREAVEELAATPGGGTTVNTHFFSGVAAPDAAAGARSNFNVTVPGLAIGDRVAVTVGVAVDQNAEVERRCVLEAAEVNNDTLTLHLQAVDAFINNATTVAGWVLFITP